jgi:hypothetical protein
MKAKSWRAQLRRLSLGDKPFPAQPGRLFFDAGASAEDRIRYRGSGKSGHRTPTIRMTEPRLPHLFRRLANFLRAAVEESKASARGEQAVGMEEAALRLATCRSNVCGQHRPSDDRCADCGCKLRNKVTWRSAHCPRRLW